jgi:imidazolonepropionase-like amidohydrolase
MNLAFATVVLALLVQPEPPAREPVLALEHVNVIPMDRERVLEDRTVLVRGEQIVSLDAKEIPAGAQRVDGRGKWLVPGFADMHTHFLSDESLSEEYVEAELEVILMNGVTAMRNPIGKPSHLKLRERVEKRELDGPQLWIGSPQLCGKAYPGVFLGRELKTVDQARQAVRDFKSEGYDFLKLTDGLSLEVFEALHDEAVKSHIRVFGHIGANVPLAAAMKVAQQVEHLDGWLERLLPEDAPMRESVSGSNVWRARFWESVDHLDASRIEPLAREAVAAGMRNTPTLAFFDIAFGRVRREEELRETPEWSFLSEEVRKWNTRGIPAFLKMLPSAERRAKYISLRKQIVKALHAAGGKLMAGSDSPEWLLLYGFALHRELESLVDAGLSPYAALETATRNPHEWLGDLAQVGTIEPGKRADFVLLRENPLENIGATRSIEALVVRGKLIERAEIETRLEAARVKLASAPLRENPHAPK